MTACIDSVMINIGAFFMIAGGAFLVAAVVGIVAYIAVIIWISASNKFRSICKAESLIFEYRRNREELLEWKGEQDGKD